jgi:hypothetical protein
MPRCDWQGVNGASHLSKGLCVLIVMSPVDFLRETRPWGADSKRERAADVSRVGFFLSFFGLRCYWYVRRVQASKAMFAW